MYKNLRLWIQEEEEEEEEEEEAEEENGVSVEIKRNFYCILVWFGLVWFYGISTIGGYLMSNPFLYI